VKRSFLRSLSVLRFFSLSILVPLTLTAVSLGQTDPSAGILPFSVNTGGQYDSLNPATGNVMFTIPVISKAGKAPFSFNLVQNFHIYSAENSGNFAWETIAPGYGGAGGMNGLPTSELKTFLYYTTSYANCNGSNTEITLNNFNLVDTTGASHPFTNDYVTYGPCGNSGGGVGPSTDSSGYTLGITTTNPPQFSLYDRSGNQLILTQNGANRLLVTRVVDPDGVSMSVSVQFNGQETDIYTDTLGQTALTAVIGFGSGGPDKYTYTDANGHPQTVTVNYTLYTVRTNFGCSGIADPNFGNYYLPTSVVLADGGSYGISYEATRGYSQTVTGRITQLRLPDGGSITYTYSGGTNGVNCVQYFFNPNSIVTRQINDGNGHVSSWTYTTSIPDQYLNFTVTATDPMNDTTTYHFYNTYPTETIVTDANLGVLSTTVTCYSGLNTGQSACIAPQQNLFNWQGAPVKQTDVYTSLGSSGPSLVETQYDGDGNFYSATYGVVTTTKRWGVGATYPPSGTPVSTETITYANINASCGPLQTLIKDHPCSVATASSAGTLAQLSYTYSSTGHPTQTSTLVGGSTSLVSFASYNPNGTIETFTDVNGAATSYYYNGTGGCNNLLLTSTVVPVSGLTRSQTWNCTGGVATSTTDFNSQVTTLGYVDQNGTADPFWRLRSTTDPLNNTTWTTYSPNGTIPATVESSMSFNNGLSTVDQLTTFDGLGRPILQQTRQAPVSSQFDTVSIGYDANGRLASKGMPCVSGASVACSSAATATQYDALGRTLQVTDGGSGYTKYSYTPGGSYLDVLVTRGPAPNNENTKRRQLEYNGLGSLTSVCELSSASNGGGNCAQASPQTGFWTQYTYDGLNRLTGVTQNVQGTSQTRTYQYDGLGRIISETNPESGTRTYIYDSTGSSPCNGGYTSYGDLVRTVDANTTNTCYYYDALHRVTDVVTNRSTIDGCKRFRYDNSAGVLGSKPSGVHTYYSLGGLVEAETDTCASPITTSSIITDEWSSYSARGETNEVWESTPHSGGYYHPTSAYWANGALNTLWISGLPVISYTRDGEGRASAVSATSGQNPVSSTSYNPGSQVTGVTFGSGDSDALTFDPNTGRETQYKFTVNGSSEVSNLNWNQNGSLSSLGITDPFNAGNTQSCTYVHDDLSRIQSAGCGSVWSQTFSYDPFGNVTKSGSISWMPGYSSSTNRYRLGGTSYDADGNVLNDTFHTYGWNADGKMVSMDSMSLTYDAFGRRVEQNQSGTYTEIVYTPMGTKLGLFRGQGIQQVYVPLPRGDVAEYLSWGLSHYRHADWLGSNRLESSTTRTVLDDIAYAPFGEPYAETGNGEISFTGQNSNMVWPQYDFIFRQYQPQQGRWLSPDPAGRAAANPMNPQSWNRYAYVLNNPLGAIDPNGLDCVYLDDPGTTVESIDHNATPADCSGNDNGGYWVPGNVQDSSWVTSIDSENNQIGAFSVLVNGDKGWTATTNQLGGGWGTLDVGAANNGGIWNNIANWFSTAKFLGTGGSLWIAHPKVPVGWSPGVTFVSDGKNLHGCVSLLAGGVGAKVPGGSAGPLFGDPSKALAIVQGWSVSVNVNTPFFGLGGQVTASSAGTLAGPTIGSPGVSVQVGYSSCE
jgi:RHS repeat-associated protein